MRVQRATAAASRTNATLTRSCLRELVMEDTAPTVVKTHSAFTVSCVVSRSTSTQRPATASTVRATQKVDLSAIFSRCRNLSRINVGKGGFSV